MRFDSAEYFYFLAIALLYWWSARRHASLRFLGIFVLSCVFYAAANWKYLGLILFSTGLDFLVGRALGREEREGRRKLLLLVSLVGNLGMLGFFKYAGFLLDASADIAGALGLEYTPPEFHRPALPVGISFYTFQTLSYSIDVYRRKLEPIDSPIAFGTFVTYFPQLVAGPIVRASEFLPQMVNVPTLRTQRVREGLVLIGTGLVKKIAIADFLSVNLVDRIFASPDRFTGAETIVGLYAFTMQIYCDFSGYTDVARGSAKLMGFELPENFDRPYMATNPAEFWRHWHMTLSRWLRDYLYFPLGGSRNGPVRAYWNLWLTMFLIGIWHGASWTFVIYGSMQASVMVIHRYVSRRSGRPRDAVDPFATRAFKIFLNMQFVVFSRILFRASSIQNAGDVTERILSGSWTLAQVHWTVWAVLVSTFVAHYTPKAWFAGLRARLEALPAPVIGILLGILAIALAKIGAGQTVPYIYFQF